MSDNTILNIAINCPLRQSFDYLPPVGCAADTIQAGQRVKVPFGNRTMTGVVLGSKASAEVQPEQLKTVAAVLDEHPVISQTLLNLGAWMSDYYQHPIGECMATLLPPLLRKGEAIPSIAQTFWQLTEQGRNAEPAKNAHKQRHALSTLRTVNELADAQKSLHDIDAATLKALQAKALVTVEERTPQPMLFSEAHIRRSALQLNQQQTATLQSFEEGFDTFRPILLEGITGSGKTEVYLQLIERVLLAGKQALVLVPEIGLTPQTIERFQRRFDCGMAIFHSNLTDRQRLVDWQRARTGIARIIIGTRSALFTATAELGIIIVDEEHDLSYKQQDGLRYSARDLACVRAKLEGIPVILGSATPSLETLNNADSQKFEHWQLTERAGHAKPATVELVDIRNQAMHDGIAESVLPYLQDCLKRQEQALIFINRRGFAPTLICHDCGWVGQCDACDARMTLHMKARHLRCHHCQAIAPIPYQCPACQSTELVYQGAGTERLESYLQQAFPDTPVFRIDRDTTGGNQSMQSLLQKVHETPSALLVGTQMLAKGHHFPNVTLVVILEADGALMGTDYRATERFGQLLTQIIGRAGREEKPGHALIQTHYPDHAQLQKLVHFGYRRLAMDLLAMRREMGLPPFSYQALVRLEAKDAQQAIHILQQVQQSVAGLPVVAIGPFPAHLQRRAWYFRYQLMVQAQSRAQLKHAVHIMIQAAQPLIKPAQHRFSIDIDPQEVS